MEENKAKGLAKLPKVINALILFSYLILFVIYISSLVSNINIPIETGFYWIWLATVIFLVLKNNLGSLIILKSGLMVYIVGVLLVILTIDALGELMFRVAFINFSVGIFLALLEHKKIRV